MTEKSNETTFGYLETRPVGLGDDTSAVPLARDSKPTESAAPSTAPLGNSLPVRPSSLWATTTRASLSSTLVPLQALHAGRAAPSAFAPTDMQPLARGANVPLERPVSPWIQNGPKRIAPDQPASRPAARVALPTLVQLRPSVLSPLAKVAKTRAAPLSVSPGLGSTQRANSALDSSPERRAPLRVVVELKVLAVGFKEMERQMLEGIVRVSQRRSPRLVLLTPNQGLDADVVIIDTRDSAAVKWVKGLAWLREKPVIWIDALEAPRGHITSKRPVQWPNLPTLLARAMENGPRSTGFGDSVLPVEERETAPMPLSPVASDARPAKTDVLIVDDSMAVRAYLRLLLERMGYVVHEAITVPDALDMLTRQHFGCVLMDVLMPGVDGYEGCRQVKAKMRGQVLPVVMLTSKSSPFDRIRGKMAGCDAYLTKPVDPIHLADVLENLVAAASARNGV